MAMSTTRGGRQKGEKKGFQWYECPLCRSQVTRRKSKQIDGRKAGEKVRVCKTHNHTG